MINYRSTENGIIELFVEGKLTKDEIDATRMSMQGNLPINGQLRLLEIIGDLEDVEPANIWKDLKLGLPIFDSVERAAVVSDQSWIETPLMVDEVFASAKVRTFKSDQVEEARAWLKST